MELDDAQIERYARHIVLREVGGVGQKKLLGSRVLLVGAGGLGSPLLIYLAAAGVGTLGIIDDDVVSVSNLQRQIAFKTKDVGQYKVSRAYPGFRVLLHVIPILFQIMTSFFASYSNGSRAFRRDAIFVIHPI